MPDSVGRRSLRRPYNARTALIPIPKRRLVEELDICLMLAWQCPSAAPIRVFMDQPALQATRPRPEQREEMRRAVPGSFSGAQVATDTPYLADGPGFF